MALAARAATCSRRGRSSLVLAAAFGGLGWLTRRLRGALASSRSARSWPRAPSTGTATGRCSGCSARGSSRRPRSRCCARRVDRLAAPLGRPPAALYADRRRLPPRVRRRARGPSARRSPSARDCSVRLAGRARGGRRARARARPRAATSSTQTLVVVLASTLLELTRVGGWLSRASCSRARARRRGVHPPAALAEARAPGRRAWRHC